MQLWVAHSFFTLDVSALQFWWRTKLLCVCVMGLKCHSELQAFWQNSQPQRKTHLKRNNFARLEAPAFPSYSLLILLHLFIIHPLFSVLHFDLILPAVPSACRHFPSGLIPLWSMPPCSLLETQWGNGSINYPPQSSLPWLSPFSFLALHRLCNCNSAGGPGREGNNRGYPSKRTIAHW